VLYEEEILAMYDLDLAHVKVTIPFVSKAGKLMRALGRLVQCLFWNAQIHIIASLLKMVYRLM